MFTVRELDVDAGAVFDGFVDTDRWLYLPPPSYMGVYITINVALVCGLLLIILLRPSALQYAAYVTF